MARDDPSFVIEPGLRPPHRAAAAHGYWSAFRGKLRVVLGPEAKALAFLERTLDPACAISAVSRTGAFLGLAGFRTASGGLVGGGVGALAATYGWPSALVRAGLGALLGRSQRPGVLLLDVIFVHPDARGLGVGTALLNAVERRAREAGAHSIQLDVVDTNPRARALYLRRGFVPVAEDSLGPLAPLFGFRTATSMARTVAGQGRPGAPSL